MNHNTSTTYESQFLDNPVPERDMLAEYARQTEASVIKEPEGHPSEIFAPAGSSSEPVAPHVGMEVIARRKKGLIVKLYPGMLADVVIYYNKTPELLARIPRDPVNGWCLPAVAPPVPPTLEELLDAAKLRGERPPFVGGDIVYIYNADGHQFNTPAHLKTVSLKPRRARITGILSLSQVRIELYTKPEPPEDDREDDPVGGTLVGYLGSNLPTRGMHHEGWIWPDEWVDQPTVMAPDTRPKQKCPHCGKDAVVELMRPLWSKQRPTHAKAYDSDPAAEVRLCPVCLEAVLLFAKNPAPAPDTEGQDE